MIERDVGLRWFTKELRQDPAVSDEQQDEVTAAYYRYIADLGSRLPDAVRNLAVDPMFDLHDARFRRAFVDLRRMVVELDMLQAADTQLLQLRFANARVVPDDLSLVECAVTAAFVYSGTEIVTTVLDQEVDVDGDGVFSLRLRLEPFHEFEIRFSDVDIVRRRTAPSDLGRGVFVTFPRDLP